MINTCASPCTHPHTHSVREREGTYRHTVSPGHVPDAAHRVSLAIWKMRKMVRRGKPAFLLGKTSQVWHFLQLLKWTGRKSFFLKINFAVGLILKNCECAKARNFQNRHNVAKNFVLNWESQTHLRHTNFAPATYLAHFEQSNIISQLDASIFSLFPVARYVFFNHPLSE